MATDNKTVVIVVAVAAGMIAMCGIGGMAGAGWLLTSRAPEEPVAVSEAPVVIVEEPGAGVAPSFPEETHEPDPVVDELFEHDGDPEALTPELFEELGVKGVVERMAFKALIEESYYEGKRPIDLKVTPPWQGEEAAPSVSVRQSTYLGVGGLTYLVPDVFSAVYQGGGVTPEVCKSSWGGDFDYFNERCKSFVYNELTRAKLGKPLFKEQGKVDREALKVLLKELDGIGADEPFLGVTPRQVWPAFEQSVSDYLAVWRMMEKAGSKKLLQKYEKALKVRGMTYQDGRRDMIALYYDLAEDLQVPGEVYYPHTIIGFWLRRLSDGTAKELVAFMERSQQRLGEKK